MKLFQFDNHSNKKFVQFYNQSMSYVNKAVHIAERNVSLLHSIPRTYLQEILLWILNSHNEICFRE